MNFEPKNLDEYIGQDKIKTSMKWTIKACKKRKQPFPHMLIHGGSGLGKTTLANVISRQFRVKTHLLLASSIDKAEELYMPFSKMKKNQFLFIDEIHALPTKIQECLYMAMTDNKFFAKDKSGEYEIDVPPFTLIGATTNLGKLTAPLRERFGIVIPLNKYNIDEIQKILRMNLIKLKLKATDDAVYKISKSSKLNPRSVNRLLNRCYDTATVFDKNIIDSDIVDKTLDSLQLDENGLNPDDYKILKALISPDPVGVKNLSLKTGVDLEAIETNYEPYLISLNLMERTTKGRVITSKGVDYLVKNNS